MKLSTKRQKLTSLTFALALILSVDSAIAEISDTPSCPTELNHTFRKLHSKDSVNLCDLYTGKPVLLVNTASNCGYTKQFSSLESLYQKYKDQGFQIIGFSSDDFRQEAKSEERAATVCFKNYGVTFTMLAPTSVKGDKANPTFQELAKKSQEPSWNFNKYLLLADGSVKHYGSSTNPLTSNIEVSIQQALEK